MLKQESTIENLCLEMADETFNMPGWRAEVHVSIPVLVRDGVLADAVGQAVDVRVGLEKGVLADAVGHGKTAITLALIDSSGPRVPELPPCLHGRGIPV